ncbi:unnamed protein product [Calypogeia fissa]
MLRIETDLNNATTKTIEEHMSASRNEKIDLLRKNGEELQKKVSSQNSFLNFDKLQTDPSYVSMPSLRDSESSLRFLLGNLQSIAEELWLGQDPVPVLQALFGVINKMFTVVSKLGNTREWMSGKLNILVKGLKSKEGIVEKYLQKCASTLSVVVPDILEQHRKKFISVDSFKSWHSSHLPYLEEP